MQIFFLLSAEHTVLGSASLYPFSRMDPASTPARNPKYAWRDVARAEPPKRAAGDRISDFKDIYQPYDEWIASEQASRCIQCPNPTCVEACPLGSPIPELLGLTADGRYLEAAQLLFSTHSMPELFVHVCAGERLCEAACLLGAKSDAVPIAAVARFLLDFGWKHGFAEPPLALTTGQRVAIVGAGLCGLIGADELSRSGHAVTVFDSYLKPGGRLVNGLPGFRVDKTLIEQRVALLRHRGVDFRMGVVCGRDLTLRELRQNFDATFFGLGRADPMPLEIPGAQLRGVHQAYPFVLQNSPDAPVDSPRVEVRGRRVVVLGGGETAVDAVRVAIRCGAAEATCVYRREADDMPCGPKEFNNAIEEGARFVFRSQAAAVLSDPAGAVAGVRFTRTEPGECDESGRRAVVPIAGAEFEIEADVVLVAQGFAPPTLAHCDEFAELAMDAHGLLVVDANQMTNIPGVFAGGSIVRGSVPLVEVVRDARKAVAAIDRYLADRRKHVGAA